MTTTYWFYIDPIPYTGCMTVDIYMGYWDWLAATNSQGSISLETRKTAVLIFTLQIFCNLINHLSRLSLSRKIIPTPNRCTFITKLHRKFYKIFMIWKITWRHFKALATIILLSDVSLVNINVLNKLFFEVLRMH